MNNQWSEIDNQNNEQSAIKTTNNQQSKQWAISNQRNQQSSIKRNQQSAIKTINRDHLGGNHLVFPVGIPLPGPCVVFLYFVFIILYFVFAILYISAIQNLLDYLCWNRWGIFLCKLLIILDWKDSSKEFWNKPDSIIEYWRAEWKKDIWNFKLHFQRAKLLLSFPQCSLWIKVHTWTYFCLFL